MIHPSLYEEESEKLKIRIKKLLDDCNEELMRKWERLPKVVSHSHISILQVFFEGSFTVANFSVLFLFFSQRSFSFSRQIVLKKSVKHLHCQ